MGLMSFILLLKRKTWLLLPALLLSSACSLRGPASEVSSASKDSAAPAKASNFNEDEMSAKAGLEDDLYYHIIAAELAGQFEDYQRAGTGYQKALAIVDATGLDEQESHLIARRAWEIGRASNNSSLANQAAQRWQLHDAGLKPRLARIVAVEEAALEDQLATLSDVFELESERRSAMAELLAAQYSESDSGDVVLPMLAAWIERHPEDADLLKAAAQIADGQARFGMAYQWWSQRVALLQDSELRDDSIARAAVDLRMLGEPGEAASRLHTLYVKYPESHWIALEYGRSLLQDEQAAAAAEVLAQLSADLPSNSQVHYTTGFAYFVNEQYELAAEYFELALNKGYSEHEARYWLGLAWHRAEQPAQMLDWLNTLGDGQYWERAQQLIGDTYAELGQWDDFAEHYQGLREANLDEAAQWHLAEAQSLIDVQRFEQALESTHKAVALDASDWRYRYQRGVLYAELGRYAEAEVDLRSVLAEEPDHANTLNALGYMLIDNLGDTDAGVPMVARALELEPNSAAVMDSYGWGLLLQEKYSEALFWLEKAWKAHPDHEIGAHYGEALWLKERRSEAREIWREAQLLDRGHREDKVLQAYERLGIDAD